MGPGRGDADDHRHPSPRLLHHGLDHAKTLVVGEAVRLARDAEHGEAVDAGGEGRFHERGETGGVEGAVGPKRRGGDVEDSRPADAHLRRRYERTWQATQCSREISLST